MADKVITWNRRTRLGGEMADLIDVPLSEDSEAYEVDILDGLDVLRTLTSSTPTVTYTNAQQTTDFGAPVDYFSYTVYQMGKYGRGHSLYVPVAYQMPYMVAAYEPAAMDLVYADGNAISQAFDKSQSQGHLSQVTAGERPLFKENIQNGLSVFRLDGSDDNLQRANLFSGDDPRTVVVVYKATTMSGGLDAMINLNDQTSFGGVGDAWIITPDPFLRVSGGNRAWTATTAGNWYAGAWRMSGDQVTDVDHFRNGVQISDISTTNITLNTGTGSVAIGRRRDVAGQQYDGDLGDVYMYRAALTDAQLIDLTRDLKSKWGI